MFCCEIGKKKSSFLWRTSQRERCRGGQGGRECSVLGFGSISLELTNEMSSGWKTRASLFLVNPLSSI